MDLPAIGYGIIMNMVYSPRNQNGAQIERPDSWETFDGNPWEIWSVA